MKILLLFALPMLFTCSSFGQEGAENLYVSKGRILMNDARMIEGQPITISKDSVEYYLKNSDVKSAFELTRIQKIERYNGDWRRTGMWVGMIIGTGIGIAAAVATKSTEQTGYYEQTTTVQTWPIYLGSFGGSLLGYLIGMDVHDWQTVYVNPRLTKGIAGAGEGSMEVRVGYAVRF